MNNVERRVLEKLGGLYSSLRKPLRKAPNSYTAIAFDWYPTELGKPYQITLVVKIVKVTDNEISEVKSNNGVTIEFDELDTSQKVKGSSESVGLIPKTSFYYDEKKTAVFERNLADIITHTLYSIFDGGENCIILQGPLFPKLAGRLGYRHFDRKKVIAAITFQTEWLPQATLKSLLWNTEIMKRIGNKFFKPPHEGKAYGCADIKSINGLTETMKTWAIVTSGKGKKMLYALDIFCQFPYRSDTQESLWKEKVEEMKTTFSFPGLIFRSGEPLWLPFGLACAYDLCSKYGYRPIGEIELIYKEREHQGYLYYYERDVKRMYGGGSFSSIEVVGRRAYLYQAMYDPMAFQNVVNKAMNYYEGDHDKIEERDEKVEVVVHRGSVLTKIIKNIFDRPDSNIGLWKRII